VEIGLAAAVVAQHAKRFFVFLFFGRNQPRVTRRSQVFGGIEGKPAEVAPTARALALVIGADALSAVLD
jgi:hypothetical protein